MGDRGNFIERLTPLELRWLELAGRSTLEQICDELGLSVAAVEALEVSTYNKLGDVHPTAATTDQLAVVRHLRSGHGYTGPADKSLSVLHKVHESMHG
jgi:hypothetical protein